MRKKTVFITCIIMIFCMLSGCGSNRMYASGKDGYTTITFVDGIQFDIVSSVSRNATAITNMSADMDYEMAQTYLYKDGEESYFIFNMSSIVCIAQKGTTFHFSEAADMKDALENNGNILGVWFDCPKRKAKSRDESKNGVYKCIIDANAQVSLAPDIYNDFTGELTTIEYNGTEWALFIGTIEGESFDELDKDMQNAIGYMIQSLSVYEKPEEVAEELPAVSLGGENAVSDNNLDEEAAKRSAYDDKEEPEKEVIEEVTEEVPEETTVSADEQDTNTTKAEDQPEEIEVEIVETEDVTESEESEETGSAMPEPSATLEPTATPEATIEPAATPEPTAAPEDTVTVRPEESSYIVRNNQKNIVQVDNNVYDTDIYSMLEVGKKARISTLGNNSEAVVCVKEILTGQDAVDLIRSYCMDGTLRYEYFEAPDGCSWQVAHYELDQLSGYVDVRLRGLDGENLRFRGIEYSQRTYDILISDTEFYSFYAVPNGCKEYALEIGEGTIDNTQKSGYFHIKH